MIGVRKALDVVFTQRELKILDDILPEFSRKEKEEEKSLDDSVESDIKKMYKKVCQKYKKYS